MMNVIPEMSIRYLFFYYYHWVHTTAGGLLVPEGIIRPVVSVSALTWFIRYVYYWKLQFLHNVIINKSKMFLPQAYPLCRFLQSQLGQLVYFLPTDLN
jgi:hypothetical protein